jgi:predicted HD phosphohydrolase/predicted nucleotidyltransferase
MTSGKLRRQIAFEAARLLYTRQESEYYRAKQKAGGRICRGWVKPADLPSNAEIRDEVQSLARLYEGDRRNENLREMRFEALRMMRILRRFRPRLIGSVMTGHVRHGSDIDLHIFSDSVEAVSATLEEFGLTFDVERKVVRKDGAERLFTHFHVKDRFPFELTMYAERQAHVRFRSSITGKPIEKASIQELEEFLRAEYPAIDFESELVDLDNRVDRFQVYESLLIPLETVKQSPKYHPEGDVLYHSLQVFDLACDEIPYDEEFLLAALLHDVGKGVDPHDHVMAGLQALEGFISSRTAWLIEHHMVAQQVLDQTLGHRALRRLRLSDDFDELMTLANCDRAGRQRGIEVPEVEEALDYLRELSKTCNT